MPIRFDWLRQTPLERALSREARLQQIEEATSNRFALDLVKELRALREAVRPLVSACEEEFGDFPDDDGPVALPTSHITFPMIRQAREALIDAGEVLD